MLTLKAPEALVADLVSFAQERGVTRHAAALDAVAAGIAALRGRGDTSGDTRPTRVVIPPVTPDAEALADLVAERVVARLAVAGDTRGDTARRGPGWIEVHQNGLDLGVSAIKSALELLTGESPDAARAAGFLRDAALFELEPYLSGAREPKRKGDRSKAPRRPGDYQIGGLRKTDPPEGSVAAEVLTWRRSRGLSQEQAAEAFGVSRKTWGRWETGERHPEAAVVTRIRGGERWTS